MEAAKISALEALQFQTTGGHVCTVQIRTATDGRTCALVHHPRYRAAIVVCDNDGFDFAVPPEWPEIEEDRLKAAVIVAYRAVS